MVIFLEMIVVWIGGGSSGKRWGWVYEFRICFGKEIDRKDYVV